MKTPNRKTSFIPRHAEPSPGAEVTLRAEHGGDVVVDFSDGSTPLRVDRREFMRISGVAAATAAMAGAGCDAMRNPVEKIVPYVDRPEQVRIGKPSLYASVWEHVGVLVQTRAGRPIKLEGNPKHPLSRGALSARGQTAYMGLYDPDRAKGPAKIQGETLTSVSWQELDQEVINRLKSAGKQARVRLLTRSLSGSAQRALLATIAEAHPNFKHYTYEPLADEASLIANEAAYGTRALPHYRFDRADVIVSLQSDFLGTWLSPVEFTSQFSSRRDPDAGAMSKLIAFEGALTLTGANADVRYRVRPSDLATIAMGLAHQVVMAQGAGAIAGNAAIRQAVAPFTSQAVAQATGLSEEAITKAGAALAGAVGKALVVAGGVASASATGVQLEAAVNLLNAALEADGNTIERDRTSRQSQGQFSQLIQLVDEIKAQQVDLLIIADANPAYAAPLELALSEVLGGASAPFTVSCSDRVDETSQYADYIAPGSHWLESWGDSEPFDGVFALRQPAIRPLYQTRAFEESLLVWFAGAGFAPTLSAMLPESEATGRQAGPKDSGAHHTGPWYRFVTAHWRDTIYPMANTSASFDAFWEATLRQGVWESPEATRPVRPFRVSDTVKLLPTAITPAKARQAGELNSKEIVLVATIPMYDGQEANNGHLQELPDPISKQVWGSYVMVSPKTFRDAKLKNGAIVNIKIPGSSRSLSFPVLMQPGMHDDVVAVPLGHGRTHAGMVGNGVGENAFLLSQLQRDSRLVALSGFEVELSKTNKFQELANPQGAQVLDLHERPFIATTTLEAYSKDQKAGQHAHPVLDDLWKDHPYTLKWGMAVDLSKCTGCNACVIACQEENNIPVVGRQGVIEGREMHWLRIDRYYKLPDNEELAKKRHHPITDPMLAAEPDVAMSEYIEEPRVLFMPMMCQHCENAPCETVCPVLATMHSSDGLNQMVYNRCVGTRYCSNNCPFKVRRFNWYNYAEDRSDSVLTGLFPELVIHGKANARQPLPMGHNPEVTVRARGVMEKCTFCVQRIRRAKWQAKTEGRIRMRDGDVVTACQQSCPADAISFGNLADPESKVAKLHAKQRSVSPLAEINVGSSVAYLTNVWNTDKVDQQ